MAIIVEKCSTMMPYTRQWAMEKGANSSSEFIRRLDAVEKYGRDLRFAIPTSPLRHDKQRNAIGENQIYNLLGLLDTIYRFCELDSDRSNGISNLDDIATIQGSISVPFVESSVRIPINPRTSYVTESSHRDITRAMQAIQQPIQTKSRMHNKNGVARLDGTINVKLNDPQLGPTQFLSLEIIALNLYPFGDDVDDLMALR